LSKLINNQIEKLTNWLNATKFSSIFNHYFLKAIFRSKFRKTSEMSTNSQSENGESVSILGSDELDEVNQQQHKEGSQQLEEVDMEQDPERLSLKSVSSSVSSGMVGSQHTTDTEADEPLEGDEDQPLLDESDDEPIEVLETGEEAVDTAAQARAISRLILFSLVLISVPLTAMYTSYRFIFTGS
jgi:hypothetical protein